MFDVDSCPCALLTSSKIQRDLDINDKTFFRTKSPFQHKPINSTAQSWGLLPGDARKLYFVKPSHCQLGSASPPSLCAQCTSNQYISEDRAASYRGITLENLQLSIAN